MQARARLHAKLLEVQGGDTSPEVKQPLPTRGRKGGVLGTPGESPRESPQGETPPKDVRCNSSLYCKESRACVSKCM